MVAVTGVVLLASVQSGGVEIVTATGATPTLNATAGEVVLLPALSVAMLVSWCAPLASCETSSVAEYVYEPIASVCVIGDPTALPSIANWTLCTPYRSDACACTAIEPVK